MITMSQTENGTRKRGIYIKEAIETLFEKDQVVEIRGLYNNNRCPTKNGFYKDFDALIKVADAMDTDPDVKGIYVVLNRIDPALFARKANRIDCAKSGAGTGDQNVIKRRWLPIDIDPERPSEISSSNEEHELALKKASRIADWLAEMGFPEPIKADSGNGAHLLYRIDLDNTAENTYLLKKCIAAIALFHTNEESKVDTTVYNASRIWKLYGTVSRKGDSIPARPHRRSKIISKPAEIKIIDISLLEKLANIVSTEEESVDDGSKYVNYGNRYNQNYPTFVLGKWLEEHNIEARHQKWVENSDIYVLRKCPFSDAHVDGAYAIQFTNGKVIAACHHESCGGRKNRWKEFRSKFEPDYSTKSMSRTEQYSYRDRKDNEFNNSKVRPVEGNYSVPSENADSMIEKDIIRINLFRCVNLLQNPPFGRQQIKNILQGRKMKKIEQYGHQKLFVYGSLKGVSDEMIMGTIDEMMQEGYLVNSGGFHPTVRITEKGKRTLGEYEEFGDTQICAHYQDEELVETFDFIPSLDSLLGKLISSSATDRRKAIEEIALLGDENAVPLLIDMLEDNNGNVRATAIKCLGEFKDPDLFEPIYKKIKDPSAIVRCHVIMALAELGTPAALRALLFCLENRDDQIRKDAVYVLGELRCYDAVNPLISVLKRDKDERVKEEALISLGKIRDPTTLKIIQQELSRNSLVNKEAACISLGHFKDFSSIDTLIGYTKHPYEGVRMAAIQGLGLMGNPEVIDSIVPALKDLHGDVRYAAVIALDQIGSIKGIPALVKALDDPENWVIMRVMDALAHIGYVQSLNHLETYLDCPDQDMQDCARKAIKEIRSKWNIEKWDIED